MTKSTDTPKASRIRFSYDGEDYILEYDRASLVRMESELGFNLDSIATISGKIGGGELSIADLTALSAEVEKLYHGAFFKHHPGIDGELVREIVPKLGDKEGLTDALIEMFGECIDTLLVEPEPGESIAWTRE